MDHISIKGLHLHNLKHINLTIPKGKFVAVTGVSGSGKSSAIYDTLFQEGCQKYLEMIGFPEKADCEARPFDSIEGLPPTIAVQQKLIRANNPRSVIGTQTRIFEDVKKLFVTAGVRYCTLCQERLDENLICPKCKKSYAPLSTRHLSFNSKFGMCPVCSGRGFVNRLDLSKLIPKEHVTLEELFSPEWLFYDFQKELLEFCTQYGITLKTYYDTLDAQVKEKLLYGDEEKTVSFPGLYSFLEQKLKKGKVRERIYLSYRTTDFLCQECGGYKIGETGRSLKLNGMHFGQIIRLTISELSACLEEMEQEQELADTAISLIHSIQKQICQFKEFRLSYLSLDRTVPSLSGGELQRLYLMAQVESDMDALAFIFDEPTSGLHEMDKEQLVRKMKALKENGNTVICISHDRQLIREADYIVDFGPYAGENGGEIVYEGNLPGILEKKESVTGRYLAKDNLSSSRTSPRRNLKKCIKLSHITVNNLKDICVEIPLEGMVGVAGVSGSGKSSLISGGLVPCLRKRFGKEDEEDEETFPDSAIQAEGLDMLQGYVWMDQKPCGRNKRSNIYTYLDLWNSVRNVFASQPVAKEKHLSKEWFSFNSKGGCPQCKGTGTVENNYYQFGVFESVCPECKGKHFIPEVLAVVYKEKNIGDVLNMTVDQATNYFAEYREITEKLSLLEQIGMGYLVLGQSMTTLSGGEAQRIKLVHELSKKQKRKGILYIFDEPTIGLSAYDIELLEKMIEELVDSHNSCLIIEHDPQVLSKCDYILELGPEGGEKGGRIIAKGTPEELQIAENSHIGKYLKA